MQNFDVFSYRRKNINIYLKSRVCVSHGAAFTLDEDIIKKARSIKYIDFSSGIKTI